MPTANIVALVFNNRTFKHVTNRCASARRRVALRPVQAIKQVNADSNWFLSQVLGNLSTTKNKI